MTADTATITKTTAPEHLSDHNLVPHQVVPGVLFEKRPAKTPDGVRWARIFPSNRGATKSGDSSKKARCMARPGMRSFIRGTRFR